MKINNFPEKILDFHKFEIENMDRENINGDKIMKITKRQLRRIIREERTKVLKEMHGRPDMRPNPNAPGAIDPRYMQARAIFEEAQQEVADLLGIGIEDIQEMAEIKSDLTFAVFLGEALEDARPMPSYSDQMRASDR